MHQLKPNRTNYICSSSSNLAEICVKFVNFNDLKENMYPAIQNTAVCSHYRLNLVNMAVIP